mmetsp:Transcript_8915/g.16076  ORF Transcript_8915/g.16076 Transcript_8915/m.16076 type:complete len:223 (+) Transcript_8915:449-1117(+)
MTTATAERPTSGKPPPRRRRARSRTEVKSRRTSRAPTTKARRRTTPKAVRNAPAKNLTMMTPKKNPRKRRRKKKSKREAPVVAAEKARRSPKSPPSSRRRPRPATTTTRATKQAERTLNPIRTFRGSTPTRRRRPSWPSRTGGVSVRGGGSTTSAADRKRCIARTRTTWRGSRGSWRRGTSTRPGRSRGWPCRGRDGPWCNGGRSKSDRRRRRRGISTMGGA